MSLYKTLKAHLPSQEAVISDQEFLLMGRKDYHLSQLSPVHAFLQSAGAANVPYTIRTFLALADLYASGIQAEQKNIVIADQQLTSAAVLVWLRSGANATTTRVYAPRGVSKMPPREGLLAEIYAELSSAIEKNVNALAGRDRPDALTFILGGAKKSTDTLLALDQYVAATNAVMLIRDYARIDAADEREQFDAKRVFPTLTFEGHAVCIKVNCVPNRDQSTALL